MVTHRLLEDVISGQDDGPVASLSVHHQAPHIRQLGAVEPGWPELALLEDEQPQPVLEVSSLEGGGAESLVMLLSLASMNSCAEVRKSLLLNTFRLEQLGLLVFAFLKWKCMIFIEFPYLFLYLLNKLNERLIIFCGPG